MKFEYRITLAYLIIGCAWILFSDSVLQLFINDVDLLTHIQTYKGWFYVMITGWLLFLFLQNHLNKLRNTENELENHRKNLQEMVQEKTKDLDAAIEELKAANEELYEKNDIINKQNLDLKKAMEELKATQAQLIQTDKMASLGIMTAGIAHEINNPLNFILGGVTGLENYFKRNETNDKKTSLFLDSIKTGVHRVNSIVSGLNQLSRNNDSYKEDCNIHEILDNCLLIINNQVKNRIEILKTFSSENLIVPGNVGQLHQIFLNILINASQAIEREGSISITTKHDTKNVYVEITDDGCGISKENLSKITDPFFTTKEPGVGTGLGLYITYNLIRAHRANIQFDSEQSKGTVVKITLPKSQ